MLTKFNTYRTMKNDNFPKTPTFAQVIHIKRGVTNRLSTSSFCLLCSTYDLLTIVLHFLLILPISIHIDFYFTSLLYLSTITNHLSTGYQHSTNNLSTGKNVVISTLIPLFHQNKGPLYYYNLKSFILI